MSDTGENDSPLEKKEKLPTKIRKPWVLTEARAEALRKCRERRAEIAKEKNKNKKLQQLEKKEEKIKQKKAELVTLPVVTDNVAPPTLPKTKKVKKQVVIEESESETSSSSSVEVIIKKKTRNAVARDSNEPTPKPKPTKTHHAPPSNEWVNTKPSYIFL